MQQTLSKGNEHDKKHEFHCELVSDTSLLSLIESFYVFSNVPTNDNNPSIHLRSAQYHFNDYSDCVCRNDWYF